jgi:hypothetical protein
VKRVTFAGKKEHPDIDAEDSSSPLASSIIDEKRVRTKSRALLSYCTYTNEIGLFCTKRKGTQWGLVPF